MKKSEQLKKLAQNPNLLPGIYNYCDRWCEKCKFTDRCMVYLSEKESEQKGEEDFFEEITENFQAALELIYEKAEELGIDLEKEMNDPELEKKIEDDKRKIKKNILSEFSMKYATDVHNWFEENRGHFEQYSIDVEKQVDLELPENESSIETTKKISEALEILHWYQVFISAKIGRGLNGRREIFDDEYIQEDINASIKLAILGIENSLSAWYVIFENFPQLQDDIIEFMNNLNYLNKQLNEEFPHARNFKRPYFDE